MSDICEIPLRVCAGRGLQPASLYASSSIWMWSRTRAGHSPRSASSSSAVQTRARLEGLLDLLVDGAVAVQYFWDG